jgi:hypothetical protein
MFTFSEVAGMVGQTASLGRFIMYKMLLLTDDSIKSSGVRYVEKINIS